MTMGRQCYGVATVNAASSYSIKPSTSTEEWTVHNIYIPFGDKCSIYITDGTNEVFWGYTTSSLTGQYSFKCNTSQYVKVKNETVAAVNIAFDGIISYSS